MPLASTIFGHTPGFTMKFCPSPFDKEKPCAAHRRRMTAMSVSSIGTSFPPITATGHAGGLHRAPLRHAPRRACKYRVIRGAPLGAPRRGPFYPPCMKAPAGGAPPALWAGPCKPRFRVRQSPAPSARPAALCSRPSAAARRPPFSEKEVFSPRKSLLKRAVLRREACAGLFPHTQAA